MSYDLFYDKQFVKANDKFFPIILCGSSNLFECGTRNRNGRRVRDWWNDTYITKDYRPYATREEIMERVEEIRNGLIERNKETLVERPDWDVYDDSRFGYFSGLAINGSYTSRSTFGMFKSFFKIGMDKALTVEQLAENGVFVCLTTYEWGDEYHKKAKEKGIDFLEPAYPKTTDELMELADKWYNHYKDNGFSWQIGFTNSGKWFEEKISKIRNKYFPKGKAEYETKLVDKYWTVMSPNGYYFYKNTKYGYSYSYSYPQHRFETEKQAQQFVNRNKDRIKLTVEQVNEQAKIKVKVK
jgi:hypothetical protein